MIMKPSFYKGSNSGQVNVFSGNTYSAILPANTEKTLTVPYINVSGGGGTNSYPEIIAVITSSGSVPVFVANNSAAAIPTGDFAVANGEIVNAAIPLIKSVKTGDVLSFKTSGTNVPVGVAFYTAI